MSFSRNRVMAVRLLLPLSLALLSACGGGGGGGGGDTNPPPSSGQPPATIGAMAPAQPSNNNSFNTCPTTPAAGTGSAPVNAGQPGVISGRVTFDRIPFFTPFSAFHFPGLDNANPITLPARGVVVEAVVPTGSSCLGSVLDTAVTDGDGWYALTVNPSTAVCVRVRAQLYRQGTPSWNFAAADNTDGNSLYVMADSAVATSAADPDRNLHAGTGWTGSGYTGVRVAAPFAILDTTCKALNAVLSAHPAANVPLLTLFWSTLNTDEDGALAQGKIGGAFFDPEIPAIYLRGDAAVNTDEFDEMVVAHELGHFFTHAISRSDSIGGSHSLFNYLDPRLAFDEGWATAFAGLALNTTLYRDSDEVTTVSNTSREFRFDIQSPGPGFPSGWYSEVSMQRALYNIAAPIGNGGAGLGLSALLQTFAGGYSQTEALASIFSFGAHLKIDHPADAGAIAAILNAENIDGNGIEPFASTETNAPNSSDLPVYTVINVLGSAGQKTVCSTDVYDVSNKLSNRRYVRFQPPGNSRYRFTVTPLNGGTAGVELIDRGIYLNYLEGSVAGSAISVVSSTNLQYPQSYVLGVFHVGNAVEDSPVASADNKCFRVRAEATP